MNSYSIQSVETAEQGALWLAQLHAVEVGAGWAERMELEAEEEEPS